MCTLPAAVSYLRQLLDCAKLNKRALTIKDAVYMAAEAWEEVPPITIRRSWRKLGINCDEVDPKTTPVETDGELIEMAQALPGCENIERDHVKEWVNCDKTDPGYQILTDEEIVESVQSRKERKSEDEEDDNETAVKPSISNSEATIHLEKALEWLEAQPNAKPAQLLILRSIRNMAAERRVFPQKKMADFFVKKYPAVFLQLPYNNKEEEKKEKKINKIK
ncbi:Jerky protein-like-like [Holothuria leucospilota]|uniref:Jerky protein-like-like n=1 Tax=Holothuria leucospilota TaxID=206669 RepID=A0A9Q1BZ23_HOLLE|nr:Jerky protein-like-like [Holothuria leucospilota]